MNTDSIVRILDEEIAKLTQAKILLTQNGTATVATKRAYNRTKGISITAGAALKKRTAISPEGRKRIAEAMKKRWAERRSTVKAVKSTKPAKAVAVKKGT